MCQTTNQLKCSRDRNVLFEGVEICHVPSHHHIPLRSMTLIFWEIEHGVWRSARNPSALKGKHLSIGNWLFTLLNCWKVSPSPTIMFRALVPLLVAPRCIKPHFCCRLVGWLSTQKKGTTLETTTSSLVYPLVNKHSYGKSPFLMAKSAINGHFQ